MDSGNIRKKSVSWLKIISLGLILGLGVEFVHATMTSTPPTPPIGNVPGPILVGTTDQNKTGRLGIYMSSNPTYALEVGAGGSALIGGNITAVTGTITAQTFCIGADCRNAWPSAAAGVTSLSAGTGVTLSPNPIINTGVISANTNVIQKRVTGTCASGAISEIKADGTVSCRAIPTATVKGYQCPSEPTGCFAAGADTCKGQLKANDWCYDSFNNEIGGCVGCACYWQRKQTCYPVY